MDKYRPRKSIETSAEIERNIDPDIRSHTNISPERHRTKET